MRTLVRKIYFFRYIFLCDRWLALEEDDGMVDRILPVAGLEDLVAFKQLFSANVRKKLSNEHLWFSVFSRPTKSSFTRAQRISCCMSLLFMTMITNAMWFKSDDNAKQSQALKVGPLSFTVQQASRQHIRLKITSCIDIVSTKVF